ncbi:MAG: hypothetical protein GY710_07000 [Desulfobacteraceae bacterium]|nr:hypothetical protein [Desulfobacteraceae bacterium]
MTLNKKMILVLALCLLFSGLGDKNVFDLFTNKAFGEEEEKKTETDPAKGDGETPCPECPECPDTAMVVLRGLEDKKILIEKNKKELDQEKKELARYEEQIDEKLSALANLKKQINDDMALLEEKKTRAQLQKEAVYEAKLARLVKMYAGMKPKNAALIVDQMTLDVAQEIFLRMREASAAQILAYVDSAKAAKISERLAFKQKQF